MRISTKILIATGLLLTAGLAFYDRQLVAQFHKGDYTNPFFNYVKLDYRDFDEIELKSSNAVTLTVAQGEFNVLAHPQAGQFLTIQQEGRRLIVSARFEDRFRSVYSSPVLYVSCPTLSTFQADAAYLVRNDSVIDRLAARVNWMPSHITGFNEDSLAIREDHAANVILTGNKIGRLRATLGGKSEPETSATALGQRPAKENGPDLALEEDNQIMLADFHILGQSRLSIKGTGIKQLNYTLAEAASLTVNGAAAHYLNQH